MSNQKKNHLTVFSCLTNTNLSCQRNAWLQLADYHMQNSMTRFSAQHKCIDALATRCRVACSRRKMAIWVGKYEDYHHRERRLLISICSIQFLSCQQRIISRHAYEISTSKPALVRNIVSTTAVPSLLVWTHVRLSVILAVFYANLLPDNFHFRVKPERLPPESQSYTLTSEQQSGLTGIHRMPHMAHAGFNYREYPD